MSPSLFVLGFMAAISCLLPSTGTREGLSVLASILTCFAGVLSEAGAVESGDSRRRNRDICLQMFAIAAFLARVALFAHGLVR